MKMGKIEFNPFLTEKVVVYYNTGMVAKERCPSPHRMTFQRRLKRLSFRLGVAVSISVSCSSHQDKVGK